VRPFAPRLMLHALLLATLLLGPDDPRPAAPPAKLPVRITRVRTGGGPVGLADSVVIEKRAHRLTLFHLGRPIRSYLVALGGNPVGDKVVAGDRRTPEGLFSIAGRNPNSEYHLSLRISYPDAAHRQRAEALGVDPGGNIMIHGLPNGKGFVGAYHRTADWTNGCVALTDEEIEEIWTAVPIGTPVHIKP
jgi:murein L,D-transpeptidase YafK